MAGWRVLRAVIPNFLSTYTSRYRDRDGWWLFGLAVESLDGLVVDLLGEDVGADSPRDQVVSDAIRKFRGQMAKQHVARDFLLEATLHCQRGKAYRGIDRAWRNAGHDYTFTVRVRTVNGKELERSRHVFVAPHDPTFERQSSRAWEKIADPEDPTIVQQGQRYRAMSDLPVTVLTSWLPPHTGNYERQLPAGEEFVIINEPPEGATAVYAVPVNCEKLYATFIPWIRRILGLSYHGYLLSIKLDMIGRQCELVSGE